MIELHLHLDPLDATTSRVHDAASIGLLRAAEHVKGASQERTPVESGHLRGSQDVRSINPDQADVYVPGPYARFQEYGPHFNPEVMHHEEGMSPYLSTAMTVEGEHAIELIAAAIRAEGIFDA